MDEILSRIVYQLGTLQSDVTHIKERLDEMPDTCHNHGRRLSKIERRQIYIAGGMAGMTLLFTALVFLVDHRDSLSHLLGLSK